MPSGGPGVRSTGYVRDRPSTCVTLALESPYAQASQEAAQIAAKLRAVVGLDAAYGEREFGEATARQTAAVVRRSKTVAARKRLQSSTKVSWYRPWGRYLRSI